MRDLRITFTLHPTEDPMLCGMLAGLGRYERARRIRLLLRRGLATENAALRAQETRPTSPSAATGAKRSLALHSTAAAMAGVDHRINDDPDFDPRSFQFGDDAATLR